MDLDSVEEFLTAPHFSPEAESEDYPPPEVSPEILAACRRALHAEPASKRKIDLACRLVDHLMARGSLTDVVDIVRLIYTDLQTVLSAITSCIERFNLVFDVQTRLLEATIETDVYPGRLVELALAQLDVTGPSPLTPKQARMLRKRLMAQYDLIRAVRYRYPSQDPILAAYRRQLDRLGELLAEGRPPPMS